MEPTLMPWLYRQRARYSYRRALTQIRQGRLEAALRTLPQALAHHPHPAEVLIELGRVHWLGGQLEAALEQFTAAIALDPASVRAYGNRGLLYCQQGNEDLALADWQTALQHRPDHALIHYNRGLLYLRQQHHARALADFDAALATNPNLAEAYLHRGHSHAALGHATAAVRDWELALCNDLNLEQARLQLQQVRRIQRDRLLSNRLQAGLQIRSIAVSAQHQGAHLRLQVKRPVGVGINYFTLPNQIRALLLSWQLEHIQSFELVGKVESQSGVEWQGHYSLFQGQPCPPVRWHQVLLTALVIFPPLGLPALAYAINQHQAYQRGDYAGALHASRASQGLCRVGGIIALTLLTMTVGYWGYQRLHTLSETAAAPKPALLIGLDN